ncbi:serine hydrolase domain-containing protein [Clostridium nigeriense]|uniref:serine hydrolase domain-containing protein n=1 Tax=Clostridium nigeriense TaxID=1805470 RepID=UPI003D32AA25
MGSYNETMDNLLIKEVEEGRVVGANVLVIHNGSEIYHNTFGYSDKERKIAMSRDTIFRMYSMTKPITAVAIMILVERGEIDLNDSVSKYFSEFSNQLVYSLNEELEDIKRDITINDLLNMTAGIPYPDENHESGRQMGKLFRSFIERREKGDSPDTQEYIRAIARVPLVQQPGAKWVYGLSADILGGIIEIVTNKRFGEFIKEEIFYPLEMKDTAFFVPKDKLNRFAQNYMWNEEMNTLVPFEKSHLGEYYGEDVAYESGGAGLVSTIDDYSHFAMMMVNNGEYNGNKILERKTIELMTKDKLTKEQKADFIWDGMKGYGYGNLMRILINKEEAETSANIGEFGWDGWTGNFVSMDPKEKIVLLYFIQRCDSGVTPIVRNLKRATYEFIS